jgi:transcription antitermination factor NusG
MKKNWLVASYKINELKKLESNLLNQKFEYYLPKIVRKKINFKPKIEILFPGYIFVNTNLENYKALKYTKGIRKIIKFGDNIPYLSNEEIESIKMLEETSKINPVVSQLKIGQAVTIAKGSLKGTIAKVCSLPAKERVGILLSFFGSIRRATISQKDIIF